MSGFSRACTYRFPGAILGSGLFCLLALTHTASGQAPAPGEATTPGAAIVKVCTACHGMQLVGDTPKDYDSWHDTVQAMIDRGARGTPDEFDLVMQYLFENLTTIDVNHADADTLGAVLRASPSAVASIVARRQAHPFKDLADLESSIAGLDKAALDAKKRMIFFQ